MNITLRQLRLFLAVFETQSITAAAARQNITQSAASKVIAELETQLGFALFDRTTRRVEPTDAAIEFHAFAVDVIATMQAATRSVEELAALKRGKVSIAASPLMIYGLLAAPITEYRKRFPGVRFELHELSTDETVASVRAGAVDFGLGAVEGELPGVASEVVYQGRMRAVVSKDSPLASRERIRLADLARFNHISLRRFFSVRRTLDQLVADKGVVLPSGVEVGTLTSALGLVKQGDSVLIAPSYAAKIAEEWGMRTIAIVDIPADAHRLSLIQRRLGRPTLATRKFLQELIPRLKAISG
ncbi:LysR family transcriptional regulator [Cupriavidus nantongensis]|uniref:LysR family transcriptional regulator n=1 Tax=Cupriavidus nantongensis TaxID=1796606 RepID=UPI000A7B2DD1|nr:LysR family transcriptional regulator [Cupriavidus nantongensis]